MTKNYRTWAGWSLLLGAGLALRLAFFAVSVRRLPASSDESIMGLQALRIAREFRTPLLMMAQPYLFPLEAYAAAPFISWLPRTAFGARVIPFAMMLAGVGFLLALARRLGPWRDAWPVALLVMFGAPYLVMLQAGYALPGYPSLLMLSGATLWAVAKAREAQQFARFVAWSVFAGFAAGLAGSVTLLAAPVLATCVLSVMWQGPFRKGLIGGVGYALGAALGLVPHFAAKWIFPGAYGAVTSTYGWKEALARLWDPVLTFTLPATLGGRFPLFPDNKGTLCLVPGADRAVVVVWGVAMLWATADAAIRASRAVRRRAESDCSRWEWTGLFGGISWLCVAMFVLNRRADSSAYRYLLLAAWAFPFVLGGCYASSRGFWRRTVGAVVVALFALNAWGTVTVIRHWMRPNFARDEASLFEVQPAIECLDEQGIRYAYASYHVAYRITFATDQRIVCSQYYNERFYGWPLPYKEKVDNATRVAFVLTDAFSLRPEQFDQDLETMRVRARRERCGDWTVYSEFRPEERMEFPRICGDALIAESSDAGQDAWRLCDGNAFSRWRALSEQRAGQWVEVRWATPRPVAGMALYYNAWYQDRPRSLNLWAKAADEEWRLVARGVERAMDRFEMRNGHPVLGNQVQTIRWVAVLADALRVEVADPEPGRDWAIGEIEVLVAE